jgi:hypothetical protein
VVPGIEASAQQSWCRDQGEPTGFGTGLSNALHA